MYMRFVRLKIKEEKVWDARTFYEERVFSQLETTDGCLYAGLLQGRIHGDDYISMTVWNDPDAAKAYEHSGHFDRLLDESDELLQESDERAAGLPGVEDVVIFTGIEPEVETWNVAGTADRAALERISGGQVFVRMVGIRLRTGAFADFEHRFETEVRPTLATTPGCLGAILVAGVDDDTRVVSMTLWEREEDAVRYGLSGEFDRLTHRLKDTFSDLYQWTLAQPGDSAAPPVTGRAPDVEGYQLVVGRTFDTD